MQGEIDLHLDRAPDSVDADVLAAEADRIRGALRDLGADGVSD
jgi:hypothetical protein